MIADYNELLFHSGNILHIHAIKSKTGRTSTEELLDCLHTALENGQTFPSAKRLEVYNITEGEETAELRELLTSVKIFLMVPTREALTSAVDTLMAVQPGLSIDSLIIWYPKEMKDEPTEELLDLWELLGEFVTQKKVGRLGIADLETKVFISLHEKVKVKPEIFHLTVQSCCIVPPDLQKFSEEKEIQLLTHYDPPDILPDEQLFEEIKQFKPYWIARYQSHIRCRGVLAKKGYLAYFCQIPEYPVWSSNPDY